MTAQRIRNHLSMDRAINQNQQQQNLAQNLLQIESLETNIKQERMIIKKSKNIFIGTGFTFDLTQFYKFKKTQDIKSSYKIGSIFYQICGNTFAWVILLYSIINSSFLPIWILNSTINKYLALTWRYMLQSLMMIPFILYEKRNLKFEQTHKYTLQHILAKNHLRKLYLCSLSTTIWYIIILTAGQWTYLSHALYLGSLTNFFLSLGRHRFGYVHQFQIGGQLVIFVGIVFLLLDTIYFRYEQIMDYQLNTKNNFYLSHSIPDRVIADIACIIASLLTSLFSSQTTGIYKIFSPYLSMMIIDVMMTINLSFVAYFMNGVTFDFTQKWGMFSMFIDYQFALFLYSGIVLSIGMVVSFMLVARMWPNFVIPAFGYFLEPGFTTLFFNITKVQALPRSLSLIGYTIMTPGMLLIILGQWLFIRDKKRQQVLDNIRLYQLKDMTGHSADWNGAKSLQLKRISSAQEKHMKRQDGQQQQQGQAQKVQHKNSQQRQAQNQRNYTPIQQNTAIQTKQKPAEQNIGS